MKQLMRIVWLTLLTGLLIACSSPAPRTSTVDEAEEVADVEPAAVETAEEPVDPEPTEADAEKEEVDAEPTAAEEPVATEPAEETDTEDESEQVDSPTHTPAATVEDALVEQPYDHVKGADEPLLTIIEYGDFQ